MDNGTQLTSSKWILYAALHSYHSLRVLLRVCWLLGNMKKGLISLGPTSTLHLLQSTNQFFFLPFFLFSFVMSTSIVFKPGLVVGLIQSSCFEFWLDHWAAWVNFIFLKKSKQHRFSKKNKSQRVFYRVLSVQSGYPGF
jgi:hypothetical protein